MNWKDVTDEDYWSSNQPKGYNSLLVNWSFGVKGMSSHFAVFHFAVSYFAVSHFLGVGLGVRIRIRVRLRVRVRIRV